MVKLSVITVTYNNEKTIEDYFASVLKKLPQESEVIIVDSGSTDKTVEILKAQKGIKLIESKGNVGYGKGNNLAVNEALGEYLFFLNPDTAVLDDSIRNLLILAEGNPEYGIVAPKLIEDGGRVQPSVTKLPTLTGAIKEFFLGQTGEYESYAPKADKPTEIEAAFGAALLMRKEVFKKVGGFDERYFMFFEDLDLCRKIRKLGLKIVYDPEAEFIHKVGSSYNENKIKWSRQSDRIYHGSFIFAILSAIYFINRIKNRLLK